MREQLKPRFEAVGITTCEFRYACCWRDNGLSFAHIRKRLNLRDGELEIVALACIPCHNIIELLPEEVMTKRVLEVIANRICQPSPVSVTCKALLVTLCETHKVGLLDEVEGD